MSRSATRLALLALLLGAGCGASGNGGSGPAPRPVDVVGQPSGTQTSTGAQGSASPDTPASDTPASDTPASDTPASDTPASDTPASGTVSRDGLSARVVFEHPELVLGSDPSVDLPPRMMGTIHLVNHGSSERRVSAPYQLSSSLSWEITGGDGRRWDVQFLPPPTPPVGGIPTHDATIPAGGDVPWLDVGQISGFCLASAPTRCAGTPAVGTYRVVLGDIDVGGGVTVRTEPASFRVRRR